MSILKCPACGYRHLQAVPLCVNCGTPLAEKEATEARPGSRAKKAIVQKPPSPPPTDDDIAAYKRFLAEAVQQVPKEAPLDQSEQRSQEGGAIVSARQLIKRDETLRTAPKVWKKQTELQQYQPYETALDILAPDPFAHARGRALMIREEQTDPELWKAEKLPWTFPKNRPDIAGTVMAIESKEEVIDYPDLFAAIITLIVGLIWILVDVQQEKESDRVVMTVVRVQTYDGSLKDIRLRGNMRGANLSLGDKVSLWGWKRRGVLFVRRGFNHTTRGVISTQSVGLIMPALVVLFLLVVGIYFAPTVLPFLEHTFLSPFAQFLSFFHPHTISPPVPKGK